jgi:hypothetical protein
MCKGMTFRRAILAVRVAPGNHVCVINTHEADSVTGPSLGCCIAWVVFVEDRN